MSITIDQLRRIVIDTIQFREDQFMSIWDGERITYEALPAESSSPPPETPPPCPLEAIMGVAGGESGGPVLRLVAGYVGNELPTFAGDPVGLDADGLGLTSAVTVWLKVMVKPIKSGSSEVGYWVDGFTLVSAEFESGTTVPTNTLLDVDPDSGATTNGSYYFRWADVVEVGTAPDATLSLLSTRAGHVTLRLCGQAMEIITTCPTIEAEPPEEEFP